MSFKLLPFLASPSLLSLLPLPPPSHRFKTWSMKGQKKLRELLANMGYAVVCVCVCVRVRVRVRACVMFTFFVDVA